jgi:hypothetical protein
VENGWQEDALGQLAAGQAQHELLLSETAVGVWPPEQAVSAEAVSLLSEAGFRWTTSDEGILAQALGHTPSVEELTTVYEWDGIAMLFRETELSNKISFAYGNKPTDTAVADFLDEIRSVWEALEDPSDHLLTLAMDGENWMFLAGYPDNGRAFLRTLYKALADADWIHTVTPEAFLADDPILAPLDNIPTGSWAGDLSTWSGEADEDEGWARLAAAREAVVDAGSPLEAVDAIYAAEGSDWFWWYGIDQDSNTDDLYDWLFKAHLIGAYQYSGVTEIPPVLTLRLELPTAASLGEGAPVIDGVSTPEEGWADAVILSGDGELSDVAIAYKESDLYVSVGTLTEPTSRIGGDLHLVLYASGGPGDPSNIVTRYSGEQLGFGLARTVQINFDKIRANGAGTAAMYEADGEGGWSFASSLATTARRKAQVSERIEFMIPFSELGIEPGKSVTLVFTLERDGEMVARLPDRPLLAQIPTLIQGVEVFAMEDPAGDDHGPGSYVYPTDEVFDVDGLFDLVRYAVYDADDRWQLAIDLTALTNPWNGPQGFSHPIANLYLDVSDGGSTEMFEEGAAAKVGFDPEHPWDVFLRVTGWPAYGRHLWTAAGEGPHLVEVASDPKRGRIIVTIPKTLLPEIAGWHYVIVGSQDGYGANYYRPVGETAGQWTGGGNPDPFVGPLAYDILCPEGTTQEVILSSFNSTAKTFATLLPIEVELQSP